MIVGIRVSKELEEKILRQAGLLDQPVAAVPPCPFESEKQFQAEVMKLAKELLWRAYHTHDSRKSAAGFPDFVAVRERVVWAELKMPDGVVSADQQNWIDDLKSAGEEVYLWRPDDWPEIVRVLTVREEEIMLEDLDASTQPIT